MPDEWDYTTKGLAYICKEDIESIRSTIKELEQHGYVIRNRVRSDKGQLITMEYTILEQPEVEKPKQDELEQEKPKRENPVLENAA